MQLAVVFWMIFIVVLIGIAFAKRATIIENYNILARRFRLSEIAVPESTAEKKSEPGRADDNSGAEPTRTPQSTTISSGVSSETDKSQPNRPVSQPVSTPAPPSKPKNEGPSPAKSEPQPAAPKPGQPAAGNSATQPAPAVKPGANPVQPNRPAVQPPVKPPVKQPESKERGIYFTQVDKDGAILRVKVSRNIPVSDSPMTDSLNSLLAGPTAEEKRKGIINLIPQNTKILSAIVRGNTAYINFNEEFQFNTNGVEGYAAQLRQIIWTATEFPNVKDVQILIEGRRIDYLGEGIWIGSPVSRESF